MLLEGGQELRPKRFGTITDNNTVQQVGRRFPAEAEIFLFSTASRSALRITQPWIQWVTATISLGPEVCSRPLAITFISAQGL